MTVGGQSTKCIRFVKYRPNISPLATYSFFRSKKIQTISLQLNRHQNRHTSGKIINIFGKPRTEIWCYYMPVSYTARAIIYQRSFWKVNSSLLTAFFLRLLNSFFFFLVLLCDNIVFSEMYLKFHAHYSIRYYREFIILSFIKPKWQLRIYLVTTLLFK